MTGLFLSLGFIISLFIYLNRNGIIHYGLVSLFVLFQWLFTLYGYSAMNVTELEYFRFDPLAMLFMFTLSVVTVPALYHGYRYIVTHKETPRTRAIFFAAMTSLIMAAGAAYISNHLAVTWIFVEITTLSASALIYHHRNNRSLEGAWKYVFICAISITFVFIGILFLSLSLQHAGTDQLSYDNLLEHAHEMNTMWLRLAFIFIFTGFTAKLGLFPMYTAGIDAKDKAPAPAGALFSSLLLNMGFTGIFRTYAVVSHTSLHAWANTIILTAAVTSLFVAMVYMVKVKNIKRILAYSGVEHMGIVMLGIVAGGVGYYAAVLHIILHSLVKPALFFQYNYLYRVYQSKSVLDVGDYFRYNRAGALVLLLGFFFSAAMPPSGLFVSEFLIFRSLFEARSIAVLVAVLVFLSVIIWSFGSNMMKILFVPVKGFRGPRLAGSSPWETLSQFALLAASVYLGYNPPPRFITLIQEAVQFLPK